MKNRKNLCVFLFSAGCLVLVSMMTAGCGPPRQAFLQVPYEENHGNTCASSSLTMLIQYAGIDAEWADVFALSGGGSENSIINYNEYGYQLFRYDDCTGHTRVIIG